MLRCLPFSKVYLVKLNLDNKPRRVLLVERGKRGKTELEKSGKEKR